MTIQNNEASQNIFSVQSLSSSCTSSICAFSPTTILPSRSSYLSFLFLIKMSRGRRSSIELEVQPTMTLANVSINASHISQSDRNARFERTEQQLEASDGGTAAWRILCAAFMFEAVLFGQSFLALLWHTTWTFLDRNCPLTRCAPGFSVSFGVFQNYYAGLPEFKGNPYIPIVGTMASGIPYLGGPIMAYVVRRYQHYRVFIIWIGWPLCILGLIAGSFANSLGPLIFTQGIMYGGE